MQTLRDKVKTYEDNILSTKKKDVVSKFKIAEDAIKDLDETQLDLFAKGLEAAAKGQDQAKDGLKRDVFGERPKPKTDLGEGQGANAPTNRIEAAKEELRLAREIQAKKRAGQEVDKDYQQ